MKRISVLLVTFLLVLLAVVTCRQSTIATPNTGFTQEARIELEHALGH